MPGAPDLGDIAVDSSGTAWFTENSSSNVGPAYAGNRIAHTDGSLVIGEYPDLWHQTGVPEDSTRYDAQPGRRDDRQETGCRGSPSRTPATRATAWRGRSAASTRSTR